MDTKISGEVIGGRKLGRTLGFPTANLRLEDGANVESGIYAVRIRIDGQILCGVANIGRRPTIETNGDLIPEVYIFDFDGDLYEKRVEIEFVSRLRDELKFDTLEELRAQITRDVDDAKRILKDYCCK